jgi:hypothetical protein
MIPGEVQVGLEKMDNFLNLSIVGDRESFGDWRTLRMNPVLGKY